MNLTKESLRKGRVIQLTLDNGDTAHILAMSGRQRDEFGKWLNSRDGTFQDLYGEYLTTYLCDDAGVRLFGDDDKADAGDIPFVVLEELFSKSLAANGINRQGREDAKKD